jgi:putative transposase
VGGGDLFDSFPGLKPRAIHRGENSRYKLPRPSGRDIWKKINQIAMSYTKIWIHLVWATKKRAPVLQKQIRQKLFPHMLENARAKKIHVDFINGYIDHVHILLSLAAGQSIAQVVQLIKGESSWWINKNKLTTNVFEWQSDYFAVSVSESGVNQVRDYIKNQEIHHSKQSFDEEHQEFVEKYGWESVKIE